MLKHSKEKICGLLLLLSELILDIKYKNQMNWSNFTEEGAVAAATLRHLVNKCGKGAIRIYADWVSKCDKYLVITITIKKFYKWLFAL